MGRTAALDGNLAACEAAMNDLGIWIGIGAFFVSAAMLISNVIINRRNWHLPRGANGWQLCMGLYGIAYGGALLWPGLVGASAAWRLLTGMHFDPTTLGIVAFSHGLFSITVLFLFGGKSYWCPAACAVGAMVWTMIGISQIALSVGQGIAVPAWGIFELLGGIGYSVATVQHARRPLV